MTNGKTNMRRHAIALGIFLSLTPNLHAHHGTAAFDTTHVVTLQGTITGFEWINPHPHIYVDVKDDHAKPIKWLLECGSPLMLTRFGWTKTTIQPGDHVKIFGFRAKDGSPYMHLERIELPNG